MICRECGQKMKLLVVKKQRKSYRRGIYRYICECGNEEAKESNIDKQWNDLIDESTKEGKLIRFNEITGEIEDDDNS